MTTEEFIQQFRTADVSALALKIRQYPSVDAAFALQQIEGWQRARTKLPTLAATDGWWWPARISMEQCSSEDTAAYKAQTLHTILQQEGTSADTMVDLTGGFGIDIFYLSPLFTEAHYVERQQALCQIAEHNFSLVSRPLHIHLAQAEDYLSAMEPVSVIFMDPARRDSHGGKVFRLEDCEPCVPNLLPLLREKCELLMLKLSPMLDITEALRHLPQACSVHVVAVQNEVKEVLVICSMKQPTSKLTYTCCNLQKEGKEFFFFSPEEEAEASATIADSLPEGNFYLYEPNSTILKAGAYKLAAQRYGLSKLAPNTHIYCSLQLVPDFPGRTFLMHVAEKNELKMLTQANIICRNYPLRPEELKKKLHLKDGGDTYIIGTRAKEKAVVLLGQRL